MFNDQERVCHAYTDCKSALTRVQDILFSTLHLSYGFILNAISANKSNYSIQLTESHPENKKRNIIWTTEDIGIHIADTIALKFICTVRALLPNISIFQTDLLVTLSAIIPTGTWLWKTLEGKPVFESLRVLAARNSPS